MLKPLNGLSPVIWQVFEAKHVAVPMLLPLDILVRTAAWGSVPMPFQILEGNRRRHEFTIVLGCCLPRLREIIGVARKIPDQNTVIWPGSLPAQEAQGILEVAEHSQATLASRVHPQRPQGSYDLCQLRFAVANPTAPVHCLHQREDTAGQGPSLICSLEPLILSHILVDVLVGLPLGIG